MMILVFIIRLIHVSGKGSDAMERFHWQAVKLVNSYMMTGKMKGPACECLANSLRSLPLKKIKAGNLQDLNYSLLISLIASAVPMTVMIASILKELK